MKIALVQMDVAHLKATENKARERDVGEGTWRKA